MARPMACSRVWHSVVDASTAAQSISHCADPPRPSGPAAFSTTKCSRNLRPRSNDPVAMEVVAEADLIGNRDSSVRAQRQDCKAGASSVDNRAVVEDVVWEGKALSPFPVRADCSRLQTFWMD